MCVLNQLSVACGHSGFDLVVASLKFLPQILAPGVCFAVKSTVLKTGFPVWLTQG